MSLHVSLPVNLRPVLFTFPLPLGTAFALFEMGELVASLQGVEVKFDSIKQGGRHLGVAKHLPPFAMRQFAGDDQGGLLVKLADQMKP